MMTGLLSGGALPGAAAAPAAAAQQQQQQQPAPATAAAPAPAAPPLLLALHDLLQRLQRSGAGAAAGGAAAAVPPAPPQLADASRWREHQAALTTALRRVLAAEGAAAPGGMERLEAQPTAGQAAAAGQALPGAFVCVDDAAHCVFCVLWPRRGQPDDQQTTKGA